MHRAAGFRSKDFRGGPELFLIAVVKELIRWRWVRAVGRPLELFP